MKNDIKHNICLNLTVEEAEAVLEALTFDTESTIEIARRLKHLLANELLATYQKIIVAYTGDVPTQWLEVRQPWGSVLTTPA